MWLPEDVHSKLTSELKFVAAKMKEEPQPLRKLYFFSAIFNEVSRQLNWHWDQNLALIWVVTLSAHGSLNSRVMQPIIGTTNVGTELMMERLTEATSELAVCVENNDEGTNLYAVLGRIAGLTYAATNHGSYIVEKKLLKL